MVALILWVTLGPRVAAGELFVELAVGFVLYCAPRAPDLTRFIRSG